MGERMVHIPMKLQPKTPGTCLFRRIVFILAAAVLIMSCGGFKEKTAGSNPFFEAYDTPFEAPPFDRIKTEYTVKTDTNRKILHLIPPAVVVFCSILYWFNPIPNILPGFF